LPSESLRREFLATGATAATNLPAGCCDVLLMRNVFHYLTDPAKAK
jgi:hypothetical protein